MIIPNGTIRIKQKTAGGIDPRTGHPRRPTEEAFDAPIPCQYVAELYNALGVSEGERFTAMSYSVLIDERPFAAEQIRLSDAEGRRVGDFSVLRVERLAAVCQIRIRI